MSATTQPPAHSWASAHRALLTALAIALALAVALTIALLVSRTTVDQTIAPGGNVDVNPNGHLDHHDSPPLNRTGRLALRPH